MHKNLGNPDTVAQRDVAFMRVLLQHDYELNKLEILKQQLEFIREHPDKPIVTIMHHASSGVRLIIDVLKPDIHTDVECPEHFSRAADSGGRMDVHIFSYRQGLSRIYKTFPLRCNSAVFTNGVRRLAAEIPESMDPTESLQMLIDESRDELVEIHA
jgi:hypothetical protein